MDMYERYRAWAPPRQELVEKVGSGSHLLGGVLFCTLGDTGMALLHRQRRQRRFVPAIGAVVSALVVCGCTATSDRPTVPAKESRSIQTPHASPTYDTSDLEAVDNDPFMQRLREQEDTPNAAIQHQRYGRSQRRGFDGEFRAEDPPLDPAEARRLEVEKRRIDGRLEAVERTLRDIDMRLKLTPPERRSENQGDISRATLLKQEQRGLTDRQQRLKSQRQQFDAERRARSSEPAPSSAGPDFGTSRFSLP